MIVHRVGTFFIMLGLGLIGLFVMSDMAGAPACNFFVVGAILLGLGVFMWFRNPLPSGPASGRFRILKGAGKKQDKK